MEQAIALVNSDCAGDMLRRNHGCLSKDYLMMKVDSKLRSIWPVFGIVESHLCALLTVCMEDMCIEITRVYVGKQYRRRGLLVNLVRHLSEVGEMYGFALVMGCVTSKRMHL